MSTIGCTRTPTSSGAIEQDQDVTTSGKQVIRTYIFAERPGVDTLTLLNVIAAEGILRRDLPRRVKDLPPNSYRLSFLSAQGDTLAQAINPSVLNERLESPQPDGSIKAVEVQMKEGVFVVRCARQGIHAVSIERRKKNAASTVVQHLTIAED